MSKINKAALDKYLRDSFDEVDADKKAFILLLNGKRIQVSSGKKIWGSSGAAKNALNNHLGHMYGYGDVFNDTYEGQDLYDARSEVREMAREWAKHNIQVVSIGEYEAAKAKLKKI